MPVGKLRKYDWDRGFGFISNDLDGGEIFVHVKQLEVVPVSETGA